MISLIILNKMVSLEMHNMDFELVHHGFRAGTSCLISLLYFMEIVIKQVDIGLPVDVVYLDFSQAFDKASHNRTINKIRLTELDAL